MKIYFIVKNGEIDKASYDAEDIEERYNHLIDIEMHKIAKSKGLDLKSITDKETLLNLRLDIDNIYIDKVDDAEIENLDYIDTVANESIFVYDLMDNLNGNLKWEKDFERPGNNISFDNFIEDEIDIAYRDKKEDELDDMFDDKDDSEWDDMLDSENSTWNEGFKSSYDNDTF